MSLNGSNRRLRSCSHSRHVDVLRGLGRKLGDGYVHGGLTLSVEYPAICDVRVLRHNMFLAPEPGHNLGRHRKIQVAIIDLRRLWMNVSGI